MPSSIFFNKQRRFRPNVYTSVVVTEQPAQTSTGAVAIVGDFPQLQPDTPKTFSNLTEQKDYFHGSNPTLDLLADLAYRPTRNQDTSIQSLTLVNANRSTQARATFGSITVKSKLYGTFGNQLKVKVATNSDQYDLAVFTGTTEVEAQTVGEGEIGDIRYVIGDTYNEMRVSIDNTDFTVNGVIKKVNGQVIGGANLVGSSTVATGNITLSSDTAQTGDTVFTVVGLALNGSDLTETVTLADGTTSAISTGSFSRVTSITNDNAFDGNATISIPVFSKQLEEITDFGAELENILNLELSGTFTVDKPAQITTGLQLDEISSSDAVASAVAFKKDAYTVSEWFNNSLYVEATLDSRAPLVPAITRLTGGTNAVSVSVSDFQSAFNSLKIKPVNIVVPFTDAIAVHQIAKQHAIDSANETGYERNIWVGSTPNQTIADVFKVFTKPLNSRNVAVVCQSVKIGEKIYDPKYLAVLLASMQGATPVGTPLTRKLLHPKVLATSQNFNVEEKASLAIQRGIILVTDPRGTGLNIERSVTTYQKDGNLVYSEVSANESLNIAVRTVRNDLQELIGTKITADKQNIVQSIVTTTLQDLVKVGFILSFKDVNVSLSNDTATVSFSISVIQPLNFIIATINVG